MNNIIVTYDLHKRGQDYEAAIKKIKSLGGWAKINQSVWYLKTNHSAKYIRDQLKSVVDLNDRLFVADMGSSAWFNLSPEVSEYLNDNWDK